MQDRYHTLAATHPSERRFYSIKRQGPSMPPARTSGLAARCPARNFSNPNLHQNPITYRDSALGTCHAREILFFSIPCFTAIRHLRGCIMRCDTMQRFGSSTSGWRQCFGEGEEAVACEMGRKRACWRLRWKRGLL